MKHPIWDVPTRVFHWTLVIAVAGALVSGWLDDHEQHEFLGLSVLALLLFRLGWGLWGSQHSRFSDFVPGPRRLRKYLREGGDRAGHNPLGGIAIVAMLLVLAIQVGTGLFNGEEFGFQAPFYAAVSAERAGELGEWHELNAWLLIGLIVLHLGAIIWHQRGGKRLVQAMLTGDRPPLHGEKAPRPVWLAVLTGVVAVAAVILLLASAPEEISQIW